VDTLTVPTVASPAGADRLDDPPEQQGADRLGGTPEPNDADRLRETPEQSATENAIDTPPETADAVWAKVCGFLQEHLSEGNFAAWFGRARPVEMVSDDLSLAVPNRFTKEWIEDRYLEVLCAAATQAAKREISVTVVADESLASEDVPTPPDEHAPVAGPDIPTTDPPSTNFHPKYNFDSFVIGSSNRFAHAAALAVAEAPAEAYNPLFIYGGAGLGKTHLLHAIGRYARDFHPDLVVRYVSSEQFMNEFIFALQRRTIPSFHQRYRSTDLLLIDDIQFLEGKERTQEEFFHTFNALHPHSQIVISSDRPPKKIATLEERLRTRFEWGLITDIQPPDLETRLAILRRKAETDGLPLPQEVLSYIAGRIQTNIRELEGALIRVAAYASLTRSEMTVEMTQEVLSSVLPDSSEARVTADLVISVSAEYFDLTKDEFQSPNRSRPLVNARQIAMYLCRELTDLSLPAIGDKFGGRDHSTVLHATRKVAKQMRERESAYEQVRELTTRIRQQAVRG
jgi:chromosomal replication initiator protein